MREDEGKEEVENTAELRLISDSSKFVPRTQEQIVGCLKKAIEAMEKGEYGNVRGYFLITVEDKGEGTVSVHEDWANMAFQERVTWLSLVKNRTLSRSGG